MSISTKKWNKGKVRDTVNNKVYFEKADYDKLLAEVPKVCCVFGRVTRR